MYYFIVNPKARRGIGQKVWNRLEQEIQKYGIDYEVYITKQPGDARTFTQQLTEESREPHTIIAVGGDGTFNEILNGLFAVELLWDIFLPERETIWREAFASRKVRSAV